MQRPVAEDIAETSTTGGNRKTTSRTRHSGGRGWSYTLTSWLGLVPFLLFCLLFEVLPAIIIIQGSFSDNTTARFTFNNFQQVLSLPSNLHAFETSIAISLVTAFIGGVLGGLAAYGVYNLRTSWLRNFLIGFSSIAANFAGVPLAFAFVATLGFTGFVTAYLHDWLHINLYDLGFYLYTFGGLIFFYPNFQLPLIILGTVPALSAVRPEWKEAATN